VKECIDLSELISAYADGELGESDILRVEEHLDTCDSCSALLDFYRETSAAVSGSGPDVPEALRERVMGMVLSDNAHGAVNHDKRRKVMRVVLTRYLPVAACLALVLLTLPLFMNLNRSDSNMSKNEYSTGAVAPSSASGMAESFDNGFLPDGFADNDAQRESSFGSTSASAAPSSAPDEGGTQQGVRSPTPAPSPDLVDGSAETPVLSPASPGFPEPEDSGSPDPGDDALHYTSPTTGINPGGGDNGEGPGGQRYYVVIEIYGELPDLLTDYVSVMVDDAVLHYYVPKDVVLALIDELSGHTDVVISSVDPVGEFALVIYHNG